MEQKQQQQAGQERLLRAATSINMSALRASYSVADQIAKAKQTFTIGKISILPAAKVICREILGETAANKVEPPLIHE